LDIAGARAQTPEKVGAENRPRNDAGNVKTPGPWRN